MVMSVDRGGDIITRTIVPRMNPVTKKYSIGAYVSLKVER